MAPTYERLAQEGDDDAAQTYPPVEDLSRHRPPVYYGDGPFDPPSSDDEDGALLEKNVPGSPGLAERGERLVVGGGRQRNSSLRCLLICLALLVGLAVGIGALAAMSYTGTVYRVPGRQHITMDHIFNGTFYADRQNIRWIPEAGDGVFASIFNDYIRLVDLKANTSSNLIAMQNVRDSRGRPVRWSEWKLSPDMKYLLVKADSQKQWRHSSFNNYYIHNMADFSTYPLATISDTPETSYATWSPTGERIAFVRKNDLYVLPDPLKSTVPIRVTSTGNASLFNGVPDWVYEEEVFGADYALWWSPDSTKVAFLRSDETAVQEYAYPVYNPSGNAHNVEQYTSDIVMKYPKPGTPNPLVSVHVFDLAEYLENGSVESATVELEWEGQMGADQRIIQEVAWMADGKLLVKEVNRAADNGTVVLFDLKRQGLQGANGTVVRKLGKDGEQADDGWIDAEQRIFPLPESVTGVADAYLDVVPTKEGFNHIALFASADASEPVFLTDGEWEVATGIQALDTERKLIYFQAATPSTERHIFSVQIPEVASLAKAKLSAPTALTDQTAGPAWYSASFSPQGGFHVLNYEGPNVPWQEIRKADDAKWQYPLAQNKALNDTVWQYEAPIVIRGTVESDGHELNVVEMRPPRMDDSGRTKYPVLFRVYGGPASQTVDSRFNRDWHNFLMCGMNYVVVQVDGRGTGFKGRKFRNWVRGNLGEWEVRDQINAAKVWAGRDYVDTKRIGIWGWSYGGFMSAKVVEADAGVHSLAMSVAPVTSWQLYDSIYTERYMGMPQTNPGGYVNASISNVTAFQTTNYLLAHGSGDDNVHFANSAHLLDMFTQDSIRGFRFRMFTDSDHGISRRGAYREVFEFMTEFLVEKWGIGGRRRSW